MRWTEQTLSQLNSQGGFRLRGESMTRIEVFSDAAFAFAVTMLVISLSSMPQNYDELLTAIFRIPSFAASFAVMMLIWITHRRWSQRFGLDDGVSTFLTLVLIFVVLIYVYPLKLLMDMMFYSFSQSLFPANFIVSSTAEVAVLVAIFSVGLLLIALVQLGLYLRASSKADELCLNQLEKLLIRKESLIWIAQIVLSLLVTITALSFMSSYGFLAGIFYSLTPLLVFLLTMQTRKEIRINLSKSNGENEEA